MSLGTFLFGEPLATEESEGQTVGPLAGVPILGLDALASAAYGPEALLTVLLPLGTHALAHLQGLTLLIVALLVILFFSYRQTIAAYPTGGGAYTVAQENLGTGASLFAAAALALDYILNCAVAISAGVGALVSAVPVLLPYTLLLCLAILGLLTLMNLRGVRTTGLAFMLPTYSFIGCLLAVIGWGIYRSYVLHAEPIVPPSRALGHLADASPWLLLHAFASGCTAMTGVEAVSNGVPVFKRPSVVHAQRTLAIIIAVLLLLLVGEAVLCRSYAITATLPGEPGYQSVLSQLTAAVFGKGAAYYLTIASVTTVLCLSANTSFADFPRLCSLLARDKFLPEPLVHRGRRLTFSHGIWILSALSALLLVVFGGVTEGLIPLFAVGALFAFTMSQAGMVMHWRKRGGLRPSLVLNGIGALATSITLCIVLAAKFFEGAWLTVLIVALMIVLFRNVQRHYEFLSRVTALDVQPDFSPPKRPLAVVPLRRWDAIALKALRFALGFSPEVKVVQVLTNDRSVDDLTARWREWVKIPTRAVGLEAPELVVLHSQYRELFSPLINYINELSAANPDRQIAVIIPELVERRWYHYALHNHSASFLKALLLWRGSPQIVIVNVPWYLSQWRPERAQLAGTGRMLRRLWQRNHGNGVKV
ncbi:MAG TPA: APC family permease [Polyangiaceae bacterium]|nr:APC family permease [Polyangiaceae bacterium]